MTVRVLIVDDDVDSSVVVGNALKPAGYKAVGFASNGQEAIEKAVELTPDLVIMDIRMPGMNGIDAAKYIWNELKIPVIYLTGYLREVTQEEALTASPFGIVEKPIAAARLHACLLRSFTQELILKRERQEHRKLIDELIQNISHELRTPTTLIQGYTELALMGQYGELSPELKYVFEIFLRSIREIIELSHQSTDLLQTGEHTQLFYVTDVGEILRQTAADMQNVAQHKYKVQLELGMIEPGLCRVVSDLMRQAFRNLMFNALKFTPEGGTVTVTAKVVGDEYTISIQDTGIGVAADELDKIFDRFYQIDGSDTRRHRGTGLGLAVVRHNVGVNNGRVEVESKVGEGSTFTIYLPLHRDQ